MKQDKYNEIKKQDHIAEQEEQHSEVMLEKAVVKDDCELLNVREEPRKDAKIVTVIRKGTSVDLIPEESTENWFKIHTEDDYEGYCMKEYVEVI